MKVYNNKQKKHNKTNSCAQWINRQNKDIYVKQAKKIGYRSRAAFKLIEIQNKFKIIKKGHKILDLGSAPGGWTQVAIEISNNSNKNFCNVISVDLLNMQKIEGAVFIQKDCNQISKEDISKISNTCKVNNIISDMAPNTSGDKTKDHFLSVKLCYDALKVAKNFLNNEGNLIIKIFQGKEMTNFIADLQKYFRKVNLFKPVSSRKTSKEIYIIALNFFIKNANINA